MIDNLVFAFWFFLPAGAANMAPVLANKIPLLNKWNTPLDLSFKKGGERILGDNKRLRGVVFGVFVATLVCMVQYTLWSDFLPQFGVYQQVGIGFAAILGAVLGFGALVGDAVESFFKRRANVASGQSWFPFDQIDYIIGGLLACSLIVNLSPAQSAWILGLYFGLHLATAYVGYLLGFKDSPI